VLQSPPLRQAAKRNVKTKSLIQTNQASLFSLEKVTNRNQTISFLILLMILKGAKQ
jgi:hypothetical protein